MPEKPRVAADLDRMIHEPGRLAIVAILSAVESADFLYLLRETGLTKGNLSAHLARLEGAGYVRINKTYRGKTPLTTLRLTKTGRDAFDSYREKLKRTLEAASARRSPTGVKLLKARSG